MAPAWTWRPGDAVVVGDALFGQFATGRIASATRVAVRVRWSDGREERLDAAAAARLGLRKPN